MGDLPHSRVNLIRPFLETGVDFFGPLFIKEGSRKSKRNVKVYGAIFVCMATKAVHIELVTNLTTEAFLASLRRFFGRRGLVKRIHSDNGTNFVGAAREVRDVYEFLSKNQDELMNELAQNHIEWKFNVPRAPHHGGLWEASVKSCKKHLKKVTDNALLTFEEMNTLLIEIEATLNSRPITPMSNDPNDLESLTPGHFLIGCSLLSLPEHDLTSLSKGRLSRWQHVQSLHQHFWKRWQHEYLAELQKRNKWKQSSGPSIDIGQLVLIKEDNVPPRLWRRGRIIAVHPGRDGIVRSASIKTSTNTVERLAVRLSVLPIEE